MKLLLLSLLLLLNFSYAKDAKIYISHKLVKSYYKQIGNWSKNQWLVAAKLYNICYKYDMGYTCVAIGWQESHLGLYMVNDRTKDYGLMGINIYTYFQNHHLKNDYWYKQRIITKLIRNDDFNIEESINNLLGWRSMFNDNWIEIWAHYNGGNANPNYKYANRIVNFLYSFKRYIRNHNIELLFK